MFNNRLTGSFLIHSLSSTRRTEPNDQIGHISVRQKFDMGLKIYCLNVNSVLKHLDELRIMAVDKQPHIICLNETKLDGDIEDEELSIEGFQNIIRKDRTRHGGGVAIYVKKGIDFKIRTDLALDIESISIQLEIKYVKPIILSTLYRPPDSLVELFKPIESLLMSIDQENKECIIVGEFNCDLLKPDKNNQKHIRRIYRSYGFKQLINKPTRTTSDSKTLIDHISTNRPECVSDSGVIACGISDHDILYVVRSMCVPKLKRDPKIIKIRKYKNFDERSFTSELRRIHFDEIKNVTNDPNEMWLIWKTWYLEVLNRHAPVSDMKIKGDNLPYITMEVRQMIRQRDYLRKKANKTGSPILRQAFQQIRNKVTYKIRYLRAEHFSKSIETNKDDLRKTWKILKQAMGRDVKATSIDHVKLGDDDIISDKLKISEAFNEHFVFLGERLAEEIPESAFTSGNYLSKTKKNSAKFVFRKIQPNQIIKLLSKLKNGKASGLNLISNKFLKISKDKIAQSLCDIFNASIESKAFPDNFKIATVTPIFKEGETNELGNYRPISVISSVARVFEKLIHYQLYEIF